MPDPGDQSVLRNSALRNGQEGGFTFEVTGEDPQLLPTAEFQALYRQFDILEGNPGHNGKNDKAEQTHANRGIRKKLPQLGRIKIKQIPFKMPGGSVYGKATLGIFVIRYLITDYPYYGFDKLGAVIEVTERQSAGPSCG